MKKVKDLEIGDIVYRLYDYSILRLYKVKEIEEMKLDRKLSVWYKIVLVQMDNSKWLTFNVYSEDIKFNEYDNTNVTYFLNKESVKELLNDTLNEVNESLKLLEE
jgi:hypothetical protein